MIRELIETEDGFKITVLTIKPSYSKPKAVIQFLSGTVTKKEYYLKLATYLTEQNYIVVLFDYRGVGESKPKTLKGFDMSIADWGRYDSVAVTDWIRSKYSTLSIHLIAHSMGGQIYGMMRNWDSFDKVIFLTTSSGNFNRFSPLIYKWKVKLPAMTIFPILNRVLGYIPGSIGLGEDWPKGVAKDWCRNSNLNGLMPNYLHDKIGLSYYKQMNKKITAWYFEDDTMSTFDTIDELQPSYPNAILNIKTIHPSDVGLEKIGHFGLFKQKAKTKLWPMLIKEIEQD